MAHADFVHLRVHSAFSLLEGALKIPKIVELCQEMQMPAVAITDTGNLFGALEFSEACAKGGVQPIIGCQLALAPHSDDETGRSNGHGPVHPPKDEIVLLVQDDTGYKNLLQLVSKCHLDSDGTDGPATSLETLARFGEGLIAFTGGANGPVGRLLGEGQGPAADAMLTRLAEIFPGRLYVEIQRHGLDAERQIEGALLDLAYAHDLPLVATNEPFFATEDMYEAHDALICIADGAYISQTGRRRLTPHHRFKSADEMRALFTDLPEAVDNTVVIAQRCAYRAETRPPMLPAAPTEEGKTEPEVLRELAREGLEVRLANHVYTEDMDEEARERAAHNYRERLEYELDVIEKMGFPGYFLIVADFIRWAKEQGIPVGPGRGSGAGSVVAWSLTITDLDPLRLGLLFERFLNPERVSMPDFDIDFCQERRDEVIRYVQEKYGEDRVAQIITFGTLQPRAALRDVGRVLQMPYPQVDRICKLVPNNPANPVTLEQAIKSEPQLQNMIAEDPAVAKLVEIAGKLEGLYRHASTHAAGVVIADRPLVELIPLYRDPRSLTPVTQFPMKWAEAAGLVKFDFLGLKTLTVLAETLDHLEQRGIEIDLLNLPENDERTYEMLGRGDTTGVFQLESSGMRDILRNMKIDSFEDIIAIVSLYRPGPMDNIPSYIRRKHGDEQPDYLYPSLKPILDDTYGIMIYQEQVMQIAQELAGYTLGGADLLRRAMGKKIKSEMDAQRKVFVDGAAARSVPQSKASDIFDLVAKFAGYGFNKSHAAGYALIAYQTAYLKANYPVEFIAASMTLDIHNTDKLNTFKQELDRIGIKLLPPDINASQATFAVEDGAVRYALAAIKNVGEAAMETLVAEREANGPFESVVDLAMHLDTKSVNKRQLENLIRAGALDGLSANRRQLYEGAEIILRHAGAAAQERDSNQFGLFGAEESRPVDLNLPDLEDWVSMDRLKEEFDAIGFYLSAHPLDAYGKTLNRLRIATYADVLTGRLSGMVSMAGIVVGMKERTSAKGSRYAFVQMSDTTGVYEVIAFSETLAAFREYAESGAAVLVKVTVQSDGEGGRITAQAVSSLETEAANAAAGLLIYLDDAGSVPRLRDLLTREAESANGGPKGEIVLYPRVDFGTEVEIRLPKKYPVSPAIARAVKAIPGVVAVTET